MSAPATTLLNGRYQLSPYAQGGQGRLFIADDTRIRDKQWIAKRIELNGRSLQDHPEVVVLRLGVVGVPALSEVLPDGRHAWIIRDWVRGQTLDELRRNQGAPFAQSVLSEIAKGIGSILADLHDRGFGLIDVKPANFVRSLDGRILLIDPGSAERLEAPLNTASGTPGFTAPEVSTSSVLHSSADVYGLAATLCWLQTTRTVGPDPDLSREPELQALGRVGITSLQAAMASEATRRPSVADLLTRMSGASGPMCATCGIEVDPAKAFCGRCGAPLSGDAVPMPPKPSTGQQPRLLPKTKVTVAGTLARAIARRAETVDATPPDLARYWCAAEELAVVDGFERLIALDKANIDSYEHQRIAALRILQDFRGSGVLADEVGLGKTIEACIVLNELFARQLASRVLILAPPHLQAKWAMELATKFNDSSFVVCSGPGNWTAGRLIASHQQAWRQWFFKPDGSGNTKLKSNLPEYDVVIVDEAHHLCRADGSPTKLGELVANLRRRYLLLLTATPIRRDTRELYQLITLVRPGEFKNRAEFETRVATPLVSGPRRQATKSRQEAVGRLQTVLKRVMVRQRRRDIKVDWPEKEAYRDAVTLRTDERELREAALARARTERGLTARNLAIAAFSSPEATLALLGRAPVSGDVSTKSRRFLELLDRYENERIVCFADRPETLQSLERLVTRRNRPGIRYVGNRAQKLEAVRKFRRLPGSVLLADHTIAEGSDLQFAHILIAFDVPWNPYHLEQMIGRVYRIGQTKAVQIHAIVSDDGLDRELFDLYKDSLLMFNRHVGEVDAILSELDDDMDFPGEVWAALMQSRTEAELRKRFEKLRKSIDQALAEMRAEEQWLVDMGLN